MDGVGPQLLLIAVLIAGNAVLSGSEIALITLREGQLTRLERRSATGRTLGRLARDPNRFLATIQIGITLTGFLASATAAVTLANLLVAPLSFLGAAAYPTAVVVVTTVLTGITLVVGELAPKRLAMQRAEGWSLAAARPLSALATAAAPVIWLLSHATNAVVRLLGGDPRQERQAVTSGEIRDLVASHTAYPPEQRRIIANALEVVDHRLAEVLVPRPDVVALPEDLDAAAALDRLRQAGHSRAPVYGSHIDDSDRYVSVLGLVGASGRIAEHARPALALPESVDVLTALRELQARHEKLALVVSEHGGVAGIVTVEDLVEELVGEIYDEHDAPPERIVREPDGALIVPADLPLRDLRELGPTLTSPEASTIGGLVAERLGRLAATGDAVRVGDHVLTVLAVRRHRAHRIRITPAPHPPN